MLHEEQSGQKSGFRRNPSQVRYRLISYAIEDPWLAKLRAQIAEGETIKALLNLARSKQSEPICLENSTSFRSQE